MTMQVVMKEQFWVIAQMAIDIFMLVLLVVLLRIVSRKKGKTPNPDPVFLQAEDLLKEMRGISETLEKNLEEKRTLTQNIVTELQALLSEAEGAAIRLEGLMNTWKRIRSSGKNHTSDTERLKRSARVLFENGLAKKEIARRLDIPLGELELMLKLQTPVPVDE